MTFEDISRFRERKVCDYHCRLLLVQSLARVCRSPEPDGRALASGRGVFSG